MFPIHKIKEMAQKIILDKYPLWKQQNLQADSLYAQQALALHLRKTNDEIMMMAVSLIGDIDTIPELLNYEKNVFPNLNVDHLLPTDMPEDLKIYCRKYFKDIVESIIAYRLIRQVRLWSDKCEIENRIVHPIPNLRG